MYSYLSPVEDVPSPTSRTSSATPWSTSDDSSSNYSMSSRITGTNSFGSSVQPKSTLWLPNATPFIPKSHPPSPYQATTPTSATFNPFQSQSSWLLSEMSAMLRQNQHQSPSMVTLNSNITLSTTAQQILASNMNNGNNNNRPLRSEKIDIEIIKHLIREAKWKRQCGLKKEVRKFSTTR